MLVCLDGSCSGCTSGSLGIVGLFGEKMQEFEERWDLDWQEYEVEGERKLARDGWQVSPPGEVEGEEEELGKALGKEERGTSLEGKVVEVDRVETGGGREGGGDAGRLECGGEAEDGGGGGGRLGGGGGRGRCDVFC